jgi:hypothetical protein
MGPRGLAELDGVIRCTAPDSLALMTLLLDAATVSVGPEPDADTVALARSVVGYEPDAWILAETLAAEADLFVTLDREHFLDNPHLATLPIACGTPGDLLARVRGALETLP